MKPVLAALAALSLTLPALADSLVKRCPEPGDYFQKTTLVEIRGKLDCPDKIPAIWPAPRPSIQAGASSHSLEFANEKLAALAQKLHGKTVLLKGRIETRFEPICIAKDCRRDKDWD